MKKLALILSILFCARVAGAEEAIYQDSQGILRWKSDKSEVALFGANYCLPSACDYRAAGMVGGDRKKMIEQDLTHFTRMGWDGLRLCFWGDWENCDTLGNLINNDHLDLLEYLIKQATDRDIKMLLSPIVTYAANWPDRYTINDMPGFAAHYPKWEMPLDPKLIRAQQNYTTQLLEHTNRYTGRKIKDEPNILLMEIVNEPTQHPDKLPETTAYIDAMYKTIRKTGCNKVIFYNLSQDFRVAPAIRNSKAQGATYAWYPTPFKHGYSLPGNFLPYAANYSQIGSVDIGKRAKLVYEFDTPDVPVSYMYPAMVREFRRGGVQFTAYFAYDMLATAPYNVGWQTHNLNLVYTPAKAISAVIAAKAMKLLPRGGDYGKYPKNSSFGDFQVDYENNVSILNSPECLMHSNNLPAYVKVEAAGLKNIAGCGSSPVVSYDGTGAYFLDRVSDGVWRLELYPDAVMVDDPHRGENVNRQCYALYDMERNMTVNLPDLGTGFDVIALDATAPSRRVSGNFTVTPGIYILSAQKSFDLASLPASVNGVKLHDYVLPAANDNGKIFFRHQPEAEYVAGKPVRFECRVASSEPVKVVLYVKDNDSWFQKQYPMQQTGPYDYAVTLPAEDVKPVLWEYIIGVEHNGDKVMHPSLNPGTPLDWNYYRQQTYPVKVVPGTSPLKVFDAQRDKDRIIYTREFNSLPFRRYVTVSDSGEVVAGVSCKNMASDPSYAFPLDLTATYFIADRLAARSSGGVTPKNIVVRARRTTPDTDKILITLSQTDCAAWCAEASLTGEFTDIVIPVSALAKGKAPMLPQDWPAVNPYWYPANETAVAIDWSKVEKIYFSMRDELYPGKTDTPKGFEVVSATLEY